MRLAPTSLTACAIAMMGCSPNFAPAGGAYALLFDGAPSCATAQVEPSSMPAALTVEAWVQASANADYAAHPLVTWDGAFALWSDKDGVARFDDGKGGSGASSPLGWMDGSVHHVAGTWDGDTAAKLWIDGKMVGVGSATFGAAPSSALEVGCSSTQNTHHQGIIDEIRVSDEVRYTSDFTPQTSEFDLDDHTLYLWHADEGDGPVALDAASRADLQLTSVTWTGWSAAGEDTGNSDR